MNIKTLCLGILYFGDATGYEINKHASEGNFSHFINASYGSIYPALTQLTQAGHLTLREEVMSGKPTRKIYSITASGIEELRRALRDPVRPDVFKSEFLFLTLFSDLVSADDLRGAIVDQIDRLTQENAMLSEACPMEQTENSDTGACDFALGYGLAMNEAAISYMRKYLENLDANVNVTRAPSVDTKLAS